MSFDARAFGSLTRARFRACVKAPEHAVRFVVTARGKPSGEKCATYPDTSSCRYRLRLWRRADPGTVPVRVRDRWCCAVGVDGRRRRCDCHEPADQLRAFDRKDYPSAHSPGARHRNRGSSGSFSMAFRIFNAGILAALDPRDHRDRRAPPYANPTRNTCRARLSGWRVLSEAACRFRRSHPHRPAGWLQSDPEWIASPA